MPGAPQIIVLSWTFDVTSVRRYAASCVGFIALASCTMPVKQLLQRLDVLECSFVRSRSDEITTTAIDIHERF
jgi:hypothetical protein